MCHDSSGSSGRRGFDLDIEVDEAAVRGDQSEWVQCSMRFCGKGGKKRHIYNPGRCVCVCVEDSIRGTLLTSAYVARGSSLDRMKLWMSTYVNLIEGCKLKLYPETEERRSWTRWTWGCLPRSLASVS